VKVLLTGGSGYLGGFIARAVRHRGWQLTHLARRAPPEGGDWLAFDLAAPPDRLPPADALVHAAFDHLPGRYRGGEGDDPDGFLLRNRTGSAALFAAAADAGIARAVFLSSRAVYGAHPPGTILHESLPPQPDTLYGAMKREVEQALFALTPRLVPVSLRVTGVYGRSRSGGWHKWADLFAAFEAGRPIAPRAGTEVHGADMAAAVLTAIEAPRHAVAGRCLNVSDLLLDRRDLLAAYAAARGLAAPLPPRASGPLPNVMATDRLRALGWRPGSHARLQAFLASLPC